MIALACGIGVQVFSGRYATEHVPRVNVVPRTIVRAATAVTEPVAT